MIDPVLPLLLEPEQLEATLKAANLDIMLIDVCTQEEYDQGHVPGAQRVDPSALMCGIAPAVGKLPQAGQLNELFSQLGMRRGQHVVAMDHEGGGWAARLLWTLDVLDHPEQSLLNGGFLAWRAAGLIISTREPEAKESEYRAPIEPGPIAQVDDLMARLDDDSLAIWDARSGEEYRGERLASQRGGHIPGAINLDWLELMDPARDYRLRDLDQLREKLANLGLTPDKEIVTHCQTHHRSSLAYQVLKLLDYPNIKGYDGSWAEWGNREDTPVEPA